MYSEARGVSATLSAKFERLLPVLTVQRGTCMESGDLYFLFTITRGHVRILQHGGKRAEEPECQLIAGSRMFPCHCSLWATNPLTPHCLCVVLPFPPDLCLPTSGGSWDPRISTASSMLSDVTSTTFCPLLPPHLLQARKCLSCNVHLSVTQ